MRGKRLLKRLVFGELVPVPAELPADNVAAGSRPLDPIMGASAFKVIYAFAHRS
jgi:hypothetical protein